MSLDSNHAYEARLDRLEHAYRQQRLLTFVLASALAATLLLRMSAPMHAQGRPTSDQILTVRGLSVVDDRGVERVRIGSPLPDPIVQGRRVPRQGVVSGLLIFDADGDERGGYVVNQAGDAMLTLDAKARQQAIFIANRDGGANLSVWSGPNRNTNYVSVYAVPDPIVEIAKDGVKRTFTINGVSSK